MNKTVYLISSTTGTTGLLQQTTQSLGVPSPARFYIKDLEKDMSDVLVARIATALDFTDAVILDFTAQCHEARKRGVISLSDSIAHTISTLSHWLHPIRMRDEPVSIIHISYIEGE